MYEDDYYDDLIEEMEFITDEEMEVFLDDEWEDMDCLEDMFDYLMEEKFSQ